MRADGRVVPDYRLRFCNVMNASSYLELGLVEGQITACGFVTRASLQVDGYGSR